MLSEESGGGGEEESNFGLPDEVLQALPSDPFQQLDVARKITSIALSTRVSQLESESSNLRAALADKEQLIADLRSHIDSLDAALSDAAGKLSAAEQHKEDLVRENERLSDRVKKLTRDVSKLEVFRKTLMQSLQEDDEKTAGGPQPQIIAKLTPNDDDVSLPSMRSLSVRSQSPETGNSYNEPEASETSMSTSFPLSSQATTPRITPPGSPPSLSTSASPTRTSKPASPRRNTMSFSTSRGMFEDKNNSGRARVDGKEFFRQVRSRLSYEQFGAFLANVKELNSQKQTREETLQKAEEIFGRDNKDLYIIFEGLITRNVH